MLWSNCTMAHLYYDEDSAQEHDPCVVRLEDGVLVLEYEDEDAADRPIRVQYRGAEVGTDRRQGDAASLPEC
jgi:hypothetical protein